MEAALGSGLPIEALLVSESGEKHLAKLAHLIDSKCNVLRTTDRLFAGIADTQTPQGVAVLLPPPISTAEDILRGVPLVVVLVGVQDPGNVGTIVRAAEAFGATGAIASSTGDLGTADPFGPKAMRASAGSALRLPILRNAAADIVAQLQASNVKICAAVPDVHGKQDGKTSGLPPLAKPWEVDWKSPTALLIGNEGAGLPDKIVAGADFRVSIPQAAATTPVGVESLNAAMAATVLLYEAMRQRGAVGRQKL